MGILKAKAIAAIRGESYLQGETLQEKSFNRSKPVYKTLSAVALITAGTPFAIEVISSSAPLLLKAYEGLQYSCITHPIACVSAPGFAKGLIKGITRSESEPSLPPTLLAPVIERAGEILGRGILNNE